MDEEIVTTELSCRARPCDTFRMDTTHPHRTVTPDGQRIMLATMMANVDDKLAALIYSTALDLDTIEDQLARDAGRLSTRMHALLACLDRGLHVSPTDNVHTLGTEIDLALVRRTDKAQQLRQLCSLHPTIEFASLTERSA